MGVAALVSMAEYMNTDYSPDREYVGVPHIWVIDPRRKKAYTFSGSRLEEAQGDALVTTEPEIRLPFEEIFRGL